MVSSPIRPPSAKAGLRSVKPLCCGACAHAAAQARVRRARIRRIVCYYLLHRNMCSAKAGCSPAFLRLRDVTGGRVRWFPNSRSSDWPSGGAVRAAAWRRRRVTRCAAVADSSCRRTCACRWKASRRRRSGWWPARCARRRASSTCTTSPSARSAAGGFAEGPRGTQRLTRRTQTWVPLYARFRSRDVRHLFRVRKIAFDAREAHVHGWDGCVDLGPFSDSPNPTSSSDDVTLRRGLPNAASPERNVGLAERERGLGGTHARVRGTRTPHPWTWKPRSSSRRLPW